MTHVVSVRKKLPEEVPVKLKHKRHRKVKEACTHSFMSIRGCVDWGKQVGMQRSEDLCVASGHQKTRGFQREMGSMAW